MRDRENSSGRRKNPKRFAFAAMAALGGLGVLSYLACWLIGNMLGGISFSLPASSIGIIGGADGPTSVFVAASAGPAWELLLCIAMLFVGMVGYRRLNKVNQ